MPRTKVSKSSKRNGEGSNREEKIREFENTFEGFQNTLDSLMQDYINSYKQEFNLLLQRTGSGLMQMKICDLFDINLERFDDFEKISKLMNAKNAENSLNVLNTPMVRPNKLPNPNDEGYLTEGSTTGSSLNGSSSVTKPAFLNSSNMQPQTLSQQQNARMRTPGPLSSARARRPRRSRSACVACACGVPGSAIKSKPQAAAEYNTRTKTRKPMASRAKALSCDRSPKVTNDDKSFNSPPAFLRFPKSGELVLSKCGSPLVVNGIPGKFAHVNIPLRNGMISMQPKELSMVKPELIDNMDPETLKQLKTLHANIDKIVSMTNKTGL